MRPRGLDHVVWPVRDLDAAAALFESLGFTVTPRARHPWGTENRLVQLDGAFLELLTVGGDAAIPDAPAGTLSFGAFNRDFLARGEGGSMVVLESRDAAADRAAFESAGLKVFEPFSFGRTQELADGTTREVRFDLTFVDNPHDRMLGYFTCHNLFPENFWSHAWQSHANGVRRLEAVVMTNADPADQAEFWKAFTGRREMRATSLGITVSTPRGDIRIMTPGCIRRLVRRRQRACGWQQARGTCPCRWRCRFDCAAGGRCGAFGGSCFGRSSPACRRCAWHDTCFRVIRA